MSTSSPRPAWLPLGAAALVVPTALAGLTLLWPRPQIEAELTGAATQALAASGLAPAGVEFQGRDATLRGLTGADGQRAVEVVEGVAGVRVARLAADGNGGTGTAGVFGAAVRGDEVVLTGEVGSEAERAALVEAARAGGRSVADELTVEPGAALPGGLDAAALGRSAGTLAGLAGEDLALTVETGADGTPTLGLTGTVGGEAAAAAAQEALEAAVPAGTVDNRLAVATDAPVPLPTPQGELDPAARTALQGGIDALVAATPITFDADSPALTPAGAGTVERIVALVVAAPAARVQVDGFVATGAAGRYTAQELSDLRAATVRDALVAGGVAPDRVTTSGRGEGDEPAADDAGRRAAVTVL